MSLFWAVCKDFVFLDHKLHVSFHEIPIQVFRYYFYACVVDHKLTLFVLILTYVHELRILEESSLTHCTPDQITIPNIFSTSLLQLSSCQLKKVIRLQTTWLFIPNFLAKSVHQSNARLVSSVELQIYVAYLRRINKNCKIYVNHI